MSNFFFQKFNESIEYIKHHSNVDIMNMNKDPSNSEYSFLDFLERADIRKALHVSNVSFDVDNQLVYDKMLSDFMNSTKTWMEELLEDYGVLNYRSELFYSGETCAIRFATYCLS